MAAAKKAPGKKAPVKTASAKKAPPKRTGVKQAAKKQPASRASGKTAPAKPTTAKKATAKAPARKAPVKQVVAKKSASGSATKETATKKPPATKAPAQTSAKSGSPFGASGNSFHLPEPRGTSKDGIAYTKDFDVKFLKAQRDLLDEEKRKLMGQATRLENEANSLIEEAEMGDVQFDDEGGEGDTMVVERDATSPCRRRPAKRSPTSTRHSSDSTKGTYGYSEASGAPDPPRASRGDSVGDRARRGEGRRDRAAMTRSTRAVRGSVLIALLIVALDQLTKAWALSALDDRDIDLFWTLRLHLTRNSGMAFSRGEGLGPVIGVVALVVVAGLLVSLRRHTTAASTVAVGLVIGGAAGNVVDRLFRSAGLVPRRGDRLHRPAVVADLQRRRHGDQRGRRAARVRQHRRLPSRRHGMTTLMSRP